LVLTINGKAEVVVQDAEAYQELLERVETIEGIQRGLADVKAGRTKPARKCSTGFDANMPYRVELAKNADAELEAGRMKPARGVFKRLRRKHAVPR